MQLTMSTLSKTWIFDLDGTLVEHNGYKSGKDKLLPGVREFWSQIPETDYILILTARENAAHDKTVEFLNQNHIRFDKIIFEMPMGERILINDDKPSGLPMAFSVRPKRNDGLKDLTIKIDESL